MFKNSKLSSYRVTKIIDCFCIDIDATKTAQLLGLNRKTINRYFLVFRKLIHAHQCSEKDHFAGVIEVDESFFRPSRHRGRPDPRKRVRGTQKQPVFGIYERNGRVYTELITDCSAQTLQTIIKGRVSPEC
jgi:transposase